MSQLPSKQPDAVNSDAVRRDAPEYRDDEGLLHVRHRILGRGGEGTVISLTGEPALAAKIYHPRRPVPIDKLRCMIMHPLSRESGAHFSAAWPMSLLRRDDGSPAGYLMPKATGMELRALIAPIDRPSRSTRSLEGDYDLLAHLAHAVDLLHRHSVVVCDLQPRNILVSDTNRPVILDADSFQMSEQTPSGSVVHRARVGKFEYLAPERFAGRLSETVAEPESDWHAYALIAFRMLVGGLHPFIDATRIDPGASESDRQQRRRQLRRWSYRFGDRSASPSDQRFYVHVHPAIRSVLTRCFTTGITSPAARPQLNEWLDALNAAQVDLATCWTGHVFSGHLPTCPICAEAG